MRSSTPLFLAVLLAASMSFADARHEFIQVDDHEEPQRIRRARTRHLKAETKSMKSTKAPSMKSTKAPSMKSAKAPSMKAADYHLKDVTNMFAKMEAQLTQMEGALEEYLDADMISSMSMSMSMSM